MKFAVKNTKTPKQILKEKVINTQVVYIHTRNDKPGHVFYVGEGNAKRPYSKNRNSYWHKIVKNHGYNVHIIKTDLTVEESVALEVKLTLAYKSIGMAEACLVIGGYGNKIYSDETKRKMSISKKNISDETRKKLSIANKGRIFSDETRLKMRIARQNMSPENKQKILNAIKNRVISDETRLKMSISKINMSDETRKKLSIAAKNISDKTRLKMSVAQKGRIVSNETRKKLSIAAKNISDETRLKMSISKKNISDETRLKMSISKKNMSDETRLKISIANKGRIVSDETRLKLSIISKSRKSVSEETRKKIGDGHRKPVQAYIGGKIISNFNSAKDAELITGVASNVISMICNGKRKTTGIYDLENQQFVSSLTAAQLKKSPNCKRVSWRFI